MDCRTYESCSLKRDLGFKSHDVINTKEQTVMHVIKDAFEGEDMQTQCTVIGNRIALYFHEYKLANDYAFTRINPDKKDFNIFKEINKMHRHIKKSSKKSLIDKISKRLLELEFNSNHSIQPKFLKWVVKKKLPTL